MSFDYAVKLLNNNNLADIFCKITYLIYRQRIYHSELEHGIFVAADFLGVLIARAGGYYSYGMIASVFNPVDRCGFGIVGQSRRPLLNDRMPALCIAGHHNVFCSVLFICL